MPTNKILMVEPDSFYANPQTAIDNFFQQNLKGSSIEDIHAAAKDEFFSFVDQLTKTGIDVTVFRQGDVLQTPDATFPNNWFSTHPGGILILYPMSATNRRLERRTGIIDSLKKEYPTVIDLTSHENKNHFLEGTGSLVIDHKHRIAYASLSTRTSIVVLVEWSKRMSYELISFTSFDINQNVVYHTNVMMTLADDFAIVCMEAIHDLSEKNKLKTRLNETNHEILEISLDQMHCFCGNCLSLENTSGQKFLVMSDEAYAHFTKDQLRLIEKSCSIIHSNLKTIETYGGGGARCMMAELF